MQTVGRSKQRSKSRSARHAIVSNDFVPSEQRRAGRGACKTAVSFHLVFAFCILNFALLACAAPQTSAPAGAIVVGVRTGPNSIDPRLANDEASARVAQLLFNQLFDIGDDLRPHPMLGEQLENPDPLTYRVTLRRGVKFHDGQE